jgi:hypothetical protein
VGNRARIHGIALLRADPIELVAFPDGDLDRSGSGRDSSGNGAVAERLASGNFGV